MGRERGGGRVCRDCNVRKSYRLYWTSGQTSCRDCSDSEIYSPELRELYRTSRHLSGQLTAWEWYHIRIGHAFRCARCKRPESDEMVLAADHIIPFSQGGSGRPWNIQPLCKSCNSKKRASAPIAEELARAREISDAIPSPWLLPRACKPRGMLG